MPTYDCPECHGLPHPMAACETCGAEECGEIASDRERSQRQFTFIGPYGEVHTANGERVGDVAVRLLAELGWTPAPTAPSVKVPACPGCSEPIPAGATGIIWCRGCGGFITATTITRAEVPDVHWCRCAVLGEGSLKQTYYYDYTFTHLNGLLDRAHGWKCAVCDGVVQLG